MNLKPKDAGQKATNKELRKLERLMRRAYDNAMQKALEEIERKTVNLVLPDETLPRAQKIRAANKSTFPSDAAKIFTDYAIPATAESLEATELSMGFVFEGNAKYINKVFHDAVKIRPIPKGVITSRPQELKAFAGRSYDRRLDTKKVSDLIDARIRRAIVEGKSIPKIRQILQNEFNKQRNASLTTARTESTRIESGARELAYDYAQELEIEFMREWFATLTDDRTRSSHLALHGELAPVGKEFSNGLLMPGDPEGPPEEVCNCRCCTRPRFKR